MARLGGHREPGESLWDCAAREVREESGLLVQPLTPPQTYWFADGDEPDALVPGDWPIAQGEIVPLLAIRRGVRSARRLVLRYLARAEGDPLPLAETRWLLLLSPADPRPVLACRGTGDPAG